MISKSKHVEQKIINYQGAYDTRLRLMMVGLKNSFFCEFILYKVENNGEILISSSISIT